MEGVANEQNAYRVHCDFENVCVCNCIFHKQHNYVLIHVCLLYYGRSFLIDEVMLVFCLQPML